MKIFLEELDLFNSWYLKDNSFYFQSCEPSHEELKPLNVVN